MTQPKSKAGPAAGGAAVVVLALAFASPKLMDFLGRWEEGAQRQLVVYADKLAGNLPTVCKGITRHVTDTPIIVGERWTQAKCDAEERKAVIALQTRLVGCFKRSPVPQSVFDMATSHAWNNGLSATCNSAAMRSWNMGDWPTGCRRLVRSDTGRPVWSYVKDGRNADGSWRYKFVQGLANRRQAEYEECMKVAI